MLTRNKRKMNLNLLNFIKFTFKNGNANGRKGKLVVDCNLP